MIKSGAKIWLGLAALAALAGCAKQPIASVPPDERIAIEQNLRRDIAIMASDDFGGRKPGTLGGEKTVAFITEEMQKAGLVSGTNDPGSAWRAPVQLVSTQPFTSKLSFKMGRRNVMLEEGDAAAFTPRRRELVENADLIFVGKLSDTVTAEEIGGKIVIMMGEPGASPARRATLFDKGPAAILTVVADQAAIEGVKNAYGRERVMLKSEADGSLSAFATQDAMAKTLGKEWDKLIASAEEESFAPTAIKGTGTIEASSQRREFTSYNVLGKLAGKVPGSGAVLLMGHWDHLGECGPPEAEDRICNGAVDNASGIAVMLELSRRLVASGPYDRDVYVMATTAEESGLLGARAFVDAPAMPLNSIVAAFNFDTVAIAPAGSAVGFVGEGRTPLDPILLSIMNEAERELGSPEFAEQFIQRQDGWALLQEGVPAVFISTAFSSEIVIGPFLSGAYHAANDEIETIELGGAIDDLLLHEVMIRRVANTATYSPPGPE